MITFTLTEQLNDSQKPSHYRVAGIDVVTDVEIAHLGYFSHDMTAVPNANLPVDVDLVNFSKIYDASGQFSSGERHVCCLSNNDIIVLQVDGLKDFILSSDGVIHSSIAPSIDTALLQEVLVGPPLILQMARQGVYCLHASAARVERKICVFLGDSGQGKSTLAQHSSDGWERLSDDVLPVSISDNNVAFIKPHFPQLKLSSEEQYPIAAPECVQLDYLILLNPKKNPDDSHVCQLRELNQSDAVLSIVRHTVASKLFPSRLLKQHLLFASHLCTNIPILKFTYPMKWGGLAETCAFLQDNLRLSCNETNTSISSVLLRR